MSNHNNGSGDSLPENTPELKPIAPAVQAAEIAAPKVAEAATVKAAAKVAAKAAKIEARARATTLAAEADARAAKGKAERAQATVDALKAGTTGAMTAAKEAASIFDDFAALRKASNVTVKRIVARPVIKITRKPKNMWFRAHPDPDMSLHASLFHDEAEDGSGTGQMYYIAPAMRDDPLLANRLRYFVITPIITRANVVLLWPVPVALQGAKNYAAWVSSKNIADTGRTEWVSFAWNEHARDYDLATAEGHIDEPKWPEGALNDWLKEAFLGRIVRDDEHELMIRLRGL
jgi:hypothetical protein